MNEKIEKWVKGIGLGLGIAGLAAIGISAYNASNSISNTYDIQNAQLSQSVQVQEATESESTPWTSNWIDSWADKFETYQTNQDLINERLDNLIEKKIGSLTHETPSNGFYVSGENCFWDIADASNESLGIEQTNENLETLAIDIAQRNGYNNPHVYDGSDVWVSYSINAESLDNVDTTLDDYFLASAVNVEPTQRQEHHHLTQDGAVYKIITESGVEIGPEDFGEEDLHHIFDQSMYDASFESVQLEESSIPMGEEPIIIVEYAVPENTEMELNYSTPTEESVQSYNTIPNSFRGRINN